MKKQTEFIFRLLEYSSIDPEKSSPRWSAYIKENYLDQGWEILSTAVVRAEANSVFLGISFVRYEDAPDEVRAKGK